MNREISTTGRGLLFLNQQQHMLVYFSSADEKKVERAQLNKQHVKAHFSTLFVPLHTGPYHLLTHELSPTLALKSFVSSTDIPTSCPCSSCANTGRSIECESAWRYWKIFAWKSTTGYSAAVCKRWLTTAATLGGLSCASNVSTRRKTLDQLDAAHQFHVLSTDFVPAFNLGICCYRLRLLSHV